MIQIEKPNQIDIPRRYLGDGLYAEYDGYQFRLHTERDGQTHEVFLDPHVVDAFLFYVRAVQTKEETNE